MMSRGGNWGTPVLGDEDTPRKAEHACGEGPQMEPCRNKEQDARDAIECLLAECADVKRDLAIERQELATCRDQYRRWGEALTECRKERDVLRSACRQALSICDDCRAAISRELEAD